MDGYVHKWMIWYNDCDLLQSNIGAWNYIWEKIGHKLIIKTGDKFMGPLHYFEFFHNIELKNEQ